VYAGAGYVVLYTNPRGSQGYGEAFMRDVLREWGGGDQDDVLAFTEAVVRAFPCIDASRLGVMGGSYGGYLTSRIISSGRAHPFRAACSERALNAWDSFFGTSDIGSYFPEEQVGGVPWDAAAEYAARSPLTAASAIETPLLILHGEEDLRCPIEQAERLYVALKKLDRDVTFVRFPGASHDLSRTGRPRQRVERFRIILDWFGRKLT
jgi:dipeptidyl aminopeptidase/acylaminoacyl peptidase